MSRAALLLPLAAALAACSDSATPTSCDDRLAGVWIDADDRRYHVIDHGETIELHPLWSSGATGEGGSRSATVIRLERRDGALVGYGQRFRSIGPASCRVRFDARVEACAGEMVLALADPGELDPTDCSQRPTKVAETHRRLRLLDTIP